MGTAGFYRAPGHTRSNSPEEKSPHTHDGSVKSRWAGSVLFLLLGLLLVGLILRFRLFRLALLWDRGGGFS